MKAIGYNIHRSAIRTLNSVEALAQVNGFLRNRVGRIQVHLEDGWIRLFSEEEERGLSFRNDNSQDFRDLLHALTKTCAQCAVPHEGAGDCTFIVIGDGSEDLTITATLLPSKEEIDLDTSWLGLCVDGTWDDDVPTSSAARATPRVTLKSTPPPTGDVDGNWGDRPSYAA